MFDLKTAHKKGFPATSLKSTTLKTFVTVALPANLVKLVKLVTSYKLVKLVTMVTAVKLVTLN
jgi:hypothetical protein